MVRCKDGTGFKDIQICFGRKGACSLVHLLEVSEIDECWYDKGTKVGDVDIVEVMEQYKMDNHY